MRRLALAIAIGAIGLVLVGDWLQARGWLPRIHRRASPSIWTEQRIVRGTSLAGLVEPGTTVDVLFGYYRSHPVVRGDLIAYRYAGDADPIIKVVKAVPGDRFELRRDGTVWSIVVNDTVVTNSAGKRYELDDARSQMLALYEHDYHGVIPPGAYLILGNQVHG